MKYTGKSPTQPAAPATPTGRPSTPNSTFSGLSLRPRGLGARSPLSTPTRFLSNRDGGVGSAEALALFQGAARGVLERGEKLGINQAVRDAMGEIRRNVQGFQEARALAASGSRDSDPFQEVIGTPGKPGTNSAAAMERRNRLLAAMLEESITALKTLAAPGAENVKDTAAEALELAAAKIQFVKVHLEDSSLVLEDEADVEMPSNALSITPLGDDTVPTVEVDHMEVTTGAVKEDMDTALTRAEQKRRPSPPTAPSLPTILGSPNPDAETPASISTIVPDPDSMDTDTPTISALSPTPASSSTKAQPPRPDPPIPTRSTLAQSSFAWMLDPDTSPSTAASSANHQSSGSRSSFSHRAPPSMSTGSSAQHRRKQQNASRERNAFLFGEVVPPSDGGGPEAGVGLGLGRVLSSDEIFGLEPLRKALPRTKSPS